MCHLTKTMESRSTAEANLAATAEDHHDQLAQKDFQAEEDQEARSVALAPKMKHNVKHSSSSSSSSCNKSSSNSEDTSTVLTSEAGHAVKHDGNANVANANTVATPSGSSLTSSPQPADHHRQDHNIDQNLLPETEINLNLDPESYNINPYTQNMQMLLAPDHHDLSLPFLNLPKGACTAPMEDSTFFPTPGFNLHADHSLSLSTSFIPQQQQLPTLDHFNNSAIHHNMEQPCFGDNFQQMTHVPAYDHPYYPNYGTNPHMLHPSQMHGGGIFMNPYLAQGDEAANYMYSQSLLQQMSSSDGVASYINMAADGSNISMIPMYNSTSNMGGQFQPLINAMTSNCMETNATMVEDDHFMIQAGGQLHPIDMNMGLNHNATSLPINFMHGFPAGVPQDHHQQSMMTADHHHHQHYTNNNMLVSSNSAAPNESMITAPLSALTMNEMESQRRSLLLQQGGKDHGAAESCSSGSDQELEGAAVESASYGSRSTVYAAVKSISGSPPTRPNALKRRSPDVDGEDEQDQCEVERPPLKRSSSWNCVTTNNNINSSNNSTNSNVIDNQAHGVEANQTTINGGSRGGSARLSSIQRTQSAQDVMMMPQNSKPARARQASASDPQSVAARHRRERISERLKILQQLVPNGSKVDLVTMLEKAINYVKFLQLQVKVLATDEYWPTPLNKFPKQLATLGLPSTMIDQSSPLEDKTDKPNVDKEETNQTN